MMFRSRSHFTRLLALPSLWIASAFVGEELLTADARGLTRINCYDLSALICVGGFIHNN